MSIDMSTLDTVGEPMGVDESVEAGITQKGFKLERRRRIQELDSDDRGRTRDY